LPKAAAREPTDSSGNGETRGSLVGEKRCGIIAIAPLGGRFASRNVT
jgi:hypothetical protein